MKENNYMALQREGRYSMSKEEEKIIGLMEASKLGKKYIKCPYSDSERELIMKYIDENMPVDVKALAVQLLLTGQLSVQTIINLRREDCQNCNVIAEIKGCDQGNFQKWNRMEIIQKALSLHPEGMEFVFMYQKGTEWKKLNGSSIQMKLYNICDVVGITYKSIRKKEAIQNGK